MTKQNVYPCECGKEMKEKTGTVTRIIRAKEIKVHNAPHWQCSACGTVEFNLNTRISSIAAQAYKDGMSDVIFDSGREAGK